MSTARTTKSLLIGFANSTFQSSGQHIGPSNWTEAANKGSVPRAAITYTHWDHFEQDLDLLASLGIQTYRFSFEWSHIEPQPGQFDTEILKRYEKLIDACLARNIVPMATLYHFVHPKWFADRGGFEKRENTEDFVRYCAHMFKLFQAKVPLWCTINEPAVEAFSGYLYGQFPPHRHSLQQTVDVLANLLHAHTTVYTELKKLTNAALPTTPRIGIVHNVLRFKPRYSSDFLTRALTDRLTTITDDLVIMYFKSGRIQYSSLLLGVRINYTNPDAPRSNDFFGLNFYANAILGPNSTNIFGPTCLPGQKMGEMYLPIDPEGFAQAIDEVKDLAPSVIITETGIADKSDKLRQELLTQYLAVIDKKRTQGVQVEACYFWTPFDNYEWNEGLGNRNFGFFDINRAPRESATQLKGIISERARLNC